MVFWLLNWLFNEAKNLEIKKKCPYMHTKLIKPIKKKKKSQARKTELDPGH